MSTAIATHGLCWGCLSNIKYGAPSYYHRRFGDRWLDEIVALARVTPLHVDTRDARLAVDRKDVDYIGKSIWSYVCEVCSTRLRREQTEQESLLRQQWDEQSRRAEERQAAWERSHPRVTVGRLKQLICSITLPDDTLVFMPNEHGFPEPLVPELGREFYTALARPSPPDDEPPYFPANWSVKPFDASGLSIEALGALNDAMGTDIQLIVVMNT